MDHASLDGGGSFKAPVEQKKERGGIERELKRG